MRLTLFLILGLLLSGCATSGTKIEQAKLTQIKEGKTTKQEVVELFGKPYMQTLGSDGKTIMFYQYTKVKNRATNFIPVVGALSGGMDMEQDMLQFIINTDNVVEKYLYTDSKNAINSGLLNQK